MAQRGCGSHAWRVRPRAPLSAAGHVSVTHGAGATATVETVRTMKMLSWLLSRAKCPLPKETDTPGTTWTRDLT